MNDSSSAALTAATRSTYSRQTPTPAAAVAAAASRQGRRGAGRAGWGCRAARSICSCPPIWRATTLGTQVDVHVLFSSFFLLRREGRVHPRFVWATPAATHFLWRSRESPLVRFFSFSFRLRFLYAVEQSCFDCFHVPLASLSVAPIFKMQPRSTVWCVRVEKLGTRHETKDDASYCVTGTGNNTCQTLTAYTERLAVRVTDSPIGS